VATVPPTIALAKKDIPMPLQLCCLHAPMMVSRRPTILSLVVFPYDYEVHTVFFQTRATINNQIADGWMDGKDRSIKNQRRSHLFLALKFHLNSCPASRLQTSNSAGVYRRKTARS
jgi:hypothetical protein